MTPPDSDAPKKRTPEEWRKLAEEEQRGTEQGMAFLDAVERDGCMARVRPDYDAREVLQICAGCGLVLSVPSEHVCPREPTLPCPHGRASWRYCPHCLGLNTPIPYAAPTSDVNESVVVIGKDLARRILAALENPESPGEVFDVCNELRERMPK